MSSESPEHYDNLNLDYSIFHPTPIPNNSTPTQPSSIAFRSIIDNIPWITVDYTKRIPKNPFPQETILHHLSERYILGVYQIDHNPDECSLPRKSSRAIRRAISIARSGSGEISTRGFPVDEELLERFRGRIGKVRYQFSVVCPSQDDDDGDGDVDKVELRFWNDNDDAPADTEDKVFVPSRTLIVLPHSAILNPVSDEEPQNLFVTRASTPSTLEGAIEEL